MPAVYQSPSTLKNKADVVPALLGFTSTPWATGGLHTPLPAPPTSPFLGSLFLCVHGSHQHVKFQVKALPVACLLRMDRNLPEALELVTVGFSEPRLVCDAHHLLDGPQGSINTGGKARGRARGAWKGRAGDPGGRRRRWKGDTQAETRQGPDLCPPKSPKWALAPQYL